MLMADTGVIVVITAADVDCNNKMTWPLGCMDITHCGHNCFSHCCVLGNVGNTCRTTILNFGMQIPPLPTPLAVAISVGNWMHGLSICTGFQVASSLRDMLIPQSGMTHYHYLPGLGETDGRRGGREREIFDGKPITFFEVSGLLELIEDQGTLIST
jgi:hypothetical protein